MNFELNSKNICEENNLRIVMKDKVISIGAKALYSYLYFLEWGESKNYSTVNSLISNLGITKKTFRKYKKELEKMGYLKVEFKKKNGINRNVYYKINRR